MAKISAAERASDEYFKSTEEDDEQYEQGEMFNDELSHIADALEKMAGSDKYEVKVAITLKAVSDNSLPDNIPVIRGKFAKNYIEELIEIALHSDALKRRLRAVLGEPSGQLKRDLEEAKSEKH